jgi:hypothetical protein
MGIGERVGKVGNKLKTHLHEVHSAGTTHDCARVARIMVKIKLFFLLKIHFYNPNVHN